MIWRRADAQVPRPEDWHDPAFRCLGVELRASAEGGDPDPAAVYLVVNGGGEVDLDLPPTAPLWDLILDTTRPDLAGEPQAVGARIRAPAQSVLLFRSVPAGAGPAEGGLP